MIILVNILVDNVVCNLGHRSRTAFISNVVRNLVNDMVEERSHKGIRESLRSSSPVDVTF